MTLLANHVPPAAGGARDPRAESRFLRAKAALDDGALDEAADLFEQALALAPDWAGAWMALGTTEAARGRAAAGCIAFRRALAIDPLDRHGAALALAQSSDSVPARASPAYVAALFDAYAPRFESHLVEGLGYRGPADLAQALSDAGFQHFARTLDLGCGTGLCGVALRTMTDHLSGVDVSAQMVTRARQKAIYDRLETEDLLIFLAREPSGSADLVVAGDVMIYIGEIAPVLAGAARVLDHGGVLAFTAQQTSGTACYRVGADLRFSHARSYIETSLHAAGFDTLICADRSARREKGVEVPGLTIVAPRARPAIPIADVHPTHGAHRVPPGAPSPEDAVPWISPTTHAGP